MLAKLLAHQDIFCSQRVVITIVSTHFILLSVSTANNYIIIAINLNWQFLINTKSNWHGRIVLFLFSACIGIYTLLHYANVNKQLSRLS